MKKKKGLLYYIYCALGEKSHPHCNKTADRVAFIRLVITLQILITNCFIIAGVIRHWNKQTQIEIFIQNPHEVPGYLHQEQKEGNFQTNRNFL
jgi:hypothetical protein